MLLFSTIFCCLLVDLCVTTGTRFSLRDKRLFEISEFEITRVDCNSIFTKNSTFRSTIERGSSNEYESISVVNGDFYNARTRLSSGLPSEGGTLPRQRSMIDPNSSAMQSEIEFLSRHHSCPILMPLHASIQEMPFEPDQIPPGFDVETTPHSITAAVDNTRFDDTANTVLSQTSDNTSVRYIPGMEAQTAGAVNNREQGEEGDHILDDSDVKSELEDSSSVTNISGSDLGDVITRSSTASSFTDQQVKGISLARD